MNLILGTKVGGRAGGIWDVAWACSYGKTDGWKHHSLSSRHCQPPATTHDSGDCPEQCLFVISPPTGDNLPFLSYPRTPFSASHKSTCWEEMKCGGELKAWR